MRRPESLEVVLVHGLWYGPVTLRLLQWRLERAGFRCRRFSYRTLRRSLPSNARALACFIRQTSADEVHLVGHSLGGLVILRMLDEFGDLPPGRVVLLGTPVRGSRVARRAAEIGALKPLMGRAQTALESGFRHAPAGRETGMVAGTFGVGLGLIVPGLEGENDGTVNVAETELPGVADRLELPVTHSGLVTSGKVARAVIRFLRTGRF